MDVPAYTFSTASETGQRYLDEVLKLYVRLLRSAYGSDFLFMEDNARPHLAKVDD